MADKKYSVDDILRIFSKLEKKIDHLQCFVKECCAKIPVNVGVGVGLFKKFNQNKWEFKSLLAGNNINITQTNNEVVISSIVEPIDCQDIKNCIGIFPFGDPDKYLNQLGQWQTITVPPSFIQSVSDTANIDLTVSGTNLSADLTNTTVTPNTYGDATNIPQITVDQKGRVTSIVDIPITIPPNFIDSVSNTSTIDLTVTGTTLTADFASLNISQFTNDSNYITSSSLSNYVPYTGATQDVDLGEFGMQLGNIEFDTTPTNTPTSQGSLFWDADSQTLDLIMNGVTQKIGQEEFYYVKNQTGVTINKGTVVRANGTLGNSGRILIAPFQANGAFPSEYLMGIVAENIADGADGFVTAFGKIKQVNTTGAAVGESWVDGDVLYANPSVAGALTKVKPVAPNNITTVAIVIKADANGTLFIRPTFGSNINNDEGVLITTPTNNQILRYNNSTGLWVNDTVANALGFTPENVANKTTNINGAAGSYPDTPTVKTYVDARQIRPFAQSVNTDIDVSTSTSPFTIFSKALAGLAAGDVVFVKLVGTLLNNSNGARTYTHTLSFGSLVLTIVDGATIINSATNESVHEVECTIQIVSTSQTVMSGEIDRGVPGAIDTGQSVTAATIRKAWNESANNLTGAQTFSYQLATSQTSANNQTFKLRSFVINIYKSNP